MKTRSTESNELLAAALGYAGRGLPVLPLHSVHDGRCTCGKADCGSAGKHPRTLNGLKNATTDKRTIRRWWKKWPKANVGILTGARSGLVVVDVDPRHRGDVVLEELVAEHGKLPDTVECRTGGGGRHIYFKHPGGRIKSKAAALGAGLDIKADGGYVVAPPSLHASGRCYEWEASRGPADVEIANLPAWMLNSLQADTARPAEQPAKGDNRIPKGQRNDTLTSLAGSMRRRGMTETTIVAALQKENRQRCNPPLAEAEVAGIAASVCRYPPGDTDMHGTQTDRLVRLVLGSGVELFHDERGAPYAQVPVPGSRRIVSLGSNTFEQWMGRLAWKTNEKAHGSEVLAAAKRALGGMARFEGPEHRLHVRTALHDGAIWLDLDGARAVRVGPDGWGVVPDPPVLFRSFPHQRRLPEPARGGDPQQILQFVNLTDENAQLLLVCYLVAAMVPDIPVAALVAHGVPGSAKTTLLKVVKRLLDPSVPEVRRGAGNPTEFALAVWGNKALFLDNLTKLPDWLSDALCCAVTGDGWSKRTLYTDEGSTVFEYQRVVGLAGVGLLAQRPDLLDRSLILPLRPIPPDRRREEQEFWEQFEEARPSILGGLLDALSAAMRAHPGIRLSRRPRMADFARWGAAAAKALGYGAQAFLDAFDANVGRQNEAAIDASPIAQAVLTLMEDRSEWAGTPTKLLNQLMEVAERTGIDVRDKRWPKAATWLWPRLQEVHQNLLSCGVEASYRRTGAQRTIILRKIGGSAVTSVTPVTGTAGGPNGGTEPRGPSGKGDDSDDGDGSSGTSGHPGRLPHKSDGDEVLF